MYEPRASIPAAGGAVVIDLTASSFSIHLEEQHGDNKQNVELLILAWCSLLADSPVDKAKPHGLIKKFVKLLVTDLFGTIRLFSDLGHTLTTTLQRDDSGQACIGPYLKEMEKLPIYREYHHFLKTGDPQTLTFLLSFLWFGKKAYYEDDNYDSVAFRRWEVVEERLASLVMPDWVSNLRVIIDVLMEPFRDEHFLPSHGGGRVAERGIFGSELKNVSFPDSPRIAYLYHREKLNLVNETGVDAYPGYCSVRRPSSQTSRLKFVPKDYKTSRSICMEPLIFMWAQQAVRLWFEEAISEGPLRHNVVLSDQTRNQEASLLGSKTGSLDTLDLSSASDCVSWELVKAIFPPKVLKHLSGTRTRLVEVPDGSVRPVRKYAPMGSALCFPVQSTIYSAICILAGISEVHGLDWSQPIPAFKQNVRSLLQWTFRPRSDKGTGNGLVQDFLCYGDDIVCDTRTTSNIIAMLGALGFEVNEAKSFVGPKQAFRESCGEFHWNGHKVTPYFFKVKKLREKVEIDSLAGVIDHANKAREFGFIQLRKILIQYSLRVPISGARGDRVTNPILFTTDKEASLAIICDTPRNDHLSRRSFVVDEKSTAVKTRIVRFTTVDPATFGPGKMEVTREVAVPLGPPANTSERYQRDEVKSITIRPVRGLELSVSYDNYRYLNWWRARYGRGTGREEYTSPPATAETPGIGVGMRWTAC